METKTEKLLKPTEISEEAGDHSKNWCTKMREKEKQIAETRESHTVINVQLLEELNNMSAEEKATEWGNSCIYRVPPHIKNKNPRAYTPQIVSFGPYHHGAPHLVQMEQHKHRALSHVLNRSGKSLGDYLMTLKPMTKRLMESYRDLEEKWKDPERFLQLMLLDGVFLVEIDRVYFRKDPDYEFDYCQNDPVFSTSLSPFTNADMINDKMLLENQLPSFLYAALFAMSKRRKAPSEREKGNKDTGIDTETEEGDQQRQTTSLHYLDFMRKKITGDHRQGPEKLTKKLWSVSKLKKAGIVFEKRPRHVSDLNITFDKKKGILSLPEIELSASTQIRMLNMVIFERLHPGINGHEICAYITFMDGLIHSVEDVLLLRSRGIIPTDLPNDEKIVELLHSLRNDMTYLPKTCYDELRIEMNEFRRNNMKKWKRRFREWRRNLKETYFNNPWSSISVFAGVILLNLTTLGTVYTVLSYYKPAQ